MRQAFSFWAVTLSSTKRLIMLWQNQVILDSFPSFRCQRNLPTSSEISNFPSWLPLNNTIFYFSPLLNSYFTFKLFATGISRQGEKSKTVATAGCAAHRQRVTDARQTNKTGGGKYVSISTSWLTEKHWKQFGWQANRRSEDTKDGKTGTHSPPKLPKAVQDGPKTLAFFCATALFHTSFVFFVSFGRISVVGNVLTPYCVDTEIQNNHISTQPPNTTCRGTIYPRPFSSPCLFSSCFSLLLAHSLSRKYCREEFFQCNVGMHKMAWKDHFWQVFQPTSPFPFLHLVFSSMSLLHAQVTAIVYSTVSSCMSWLCTSSCLLLSFFFVFLVVCAVFHYVPRLSPSLSVLPA